MRITETVKAFLSKPEHNRLSSDVKPKNVLADLTEPDQYPNSGSFYDSDGTNLVFGEIEQTEVLFKQKSKIMSYRRLALQPEVTDAVDEIVNEIIFSFDDKPPLWLDMSVDNDKLKDAVGAAFTKITKLMNIKRNIYNIVRRSYIDGQIVLHAAYNADDTKSGIQSIRLLEPCMLYVDPSDGNYRYATDESTYSVGRGTDTARYSAEEIVRDDFGMYDGMVNLGYLEYASKPANLLKTLEDLLVPLRFSRSISRRVFNVDIGDLPAKRGSEVMREYQNKFKYKKFYNNTTGEVSNQQHITSMVEDYWFANRSGGKGTTVDMLDESGNLGELDDILYFSKKLYKSLKIPSSRVSNNPDSDNTYSFDNTSTTKEDMKFFMFISRIRGMYLGVFKELLRREVIATNVMSISEWDDVSESISIKFTNQNSFIEKMQLDAFTSKLDIYSTVQDYQGKLFSIETILKQVFKFTDDEIEKEFEKIKTEEKNPVYAKFYTNDDY